RAAIPQRRLRTLPSRHGRQPPLVVVGGPARLRQPLVALMRRTLRYSPLKASVGSTRAARRAGTYVARTAATVSAHPTPANVAGSAGLTSNRSVRIHWPAARSRPNPAASPTAVRTRPSRTKSQTTPDGDAPTASRTPISFVRWPNRYASTPQTRQAERAAATTANQRNTAIVNRRPTIDASTSDASDLRLASGNKGSSAATSRRNEGTMASGFPVVRTATVNASTCCWSYGR